MIKWTPIIQYREFYDFPRVFIIEYGGRFLLFDGPFDEEIDEYSPFFTVFEMSSDKLQPFLGQDMLLLWESLPSLATKRIGKIPVSDVKFDPTRRQAIESSVLDRLLSV